MLIKVSLEALDSDKWNESEHCSCRHPHDMMAQPFQPITTNPPPPAPPLKPDSRRSNTLATISFQVSVSTPPSAAQTQSPMVITSTTYASLLDSCTDACLGRQAHAHAIKCGFLGHEFVETKLLQMYGRSGCMEAAELLFDKMPLRNLYSWVALLGLYVNVGLYLEAFWLFQELQLEDIQLEPFVFPVALKICVGLAVAELGRQFHGFLIKCGFISDIYVCNAVIDMYGKCGSLADAKMVFGAMQERDVVSWNSVLTACAAAGLMDEALELLETLCSSKNFGPNIVSWSTVISGFSRNGYDEEALELLYRMKACGIEPNEQTLASILPACARLQQFNLGKEFHGYVIRHGFISSSYIVNGLIDVYRRCRDLKSAFRMFSKFSRKNAASYNTMIVVNCENGDISRARELFDMMESSGIKKDKFSWNSIISGYVENSLFSEALDAFEDLVIDNGIEPDSFTLGSVLAACADTADIRVGKEIHCQAIVRGLQLDTFVGGALVEMYGKCLDLISAQKAFNEVSKRDSATWNALLSCYAGCNQTGRIQHLIQKMKDDDFEPNAFTWNGVIARHVENGHHDAAMLLFHKMQSSHIKPDIYTVGIILPACSRLATVKRGKQVHTHCVRHGYETDVHIGAALVDMYSKCGSIKDAIMAFKRITRPNLVAYNAILTAFAAHGYGDNGIALFQKILAEGFKPDSVTFLSALSSCVHAGSVETGYKLFSLMEEYNVKPSLRHYTCMIDLLSRAGALDEAYKLTNSIPMEPDSVIWGVLLQGCVTHGNVELGEIVAARLLVLEPDDTGNYVHLANLYASAGRWSDLAVTRQILKHRKMHKNPGCSWIEDRDDIHVFLSHDMSHERTEDILATLDNLTNEMKTWSSTLV